MNNPNFERIVSTKSDQDDYHTDASESRRRCRKLTKQYGYGHNKSQLDRSKNSVVNALGYLPKHR